MSCCSCFEIIWIVFLCRKLKIIKNKNLSNYKCSLKMNKIIKIIWLKILFLHIIFVNNCFCSTKHLFKNETFLNNSIPFILKDDGNKNKNFKF